MPEDDDEVGGEDSVTYRDSRVNFQEVPVDHPAADIRNSASGGHQTPDSGQGVSELEERLRLCQKLEQELRKKEKQLQSKEEKLKIREKTIQDKQEDLAKAQAYIVKLEGKIVDLENSLKISRMTQPPTTATPLYTTSHPHIN